MKLDSRILEGKKPLNCFDTEQAKQFIGKKCYFSDDARDFMDLDKADGDTLFYVAELQNIWTAEEYCFADNSNDYRFILPLEWLKEEKTEPEKKYRAYTLKEFISDVNLGLEPWIRMRSVGTNKECKFLYTGYQETEVGEYICLGCYQFDFISLFKNYEIYINGEWQPFGIKE